MEMTIYNPRDVEREVQRIWKEKRIPEKIVKFDKNKPKFYLLDGPPYVNYIPHVGHVMTTTFKDIWGKFKYMQGYAVWFQPGFDCSGLPIENAVEKKLGITSKKEITEKIGIKKFIEECKKLAEKNKDVWMNLYRKLGAWRGWIEPYMTYKNYYLESGWWTIKKLYEKGLFSEGQRPGFWCPKCETVLAGYEVTDSYKNLEDPSIFIKFPIKGRTNEFLLVWTTTPWTLPANVAIVVHPDEMYVKAEIGTGEKLILAEKRLSVLEDLEIGYKVIERFRGKKLEGVKYEPVLDVPLQRELQAQENAHRVYVSVPIMKKKSISKKRLKEDTGEIGDEFGHMVDMETGSGLVHTAPGHGDVDNKLGKHYNLPEPSPVDEQGKLTEEAGEFAGMFVKEADDKIIEKIREKNLLLYAGRITHSYPLCWRCKSPLIYRMSKQLFLKLDTLREKILKENKSVRWLPEFAKERFHNVLVDAPDWAITRQRYWGIPLPVWTCEKCGSKRVIGSIEELKKYSVQKIEDNIDIHKDTVDSITFKCDCGGEMKREKDIMDVWFDSGISPWASLGYPFKNKDLFKRLWPVDLIDESQDQIRGWFYTLMICGYATFEEKPYKTVCLNGWTLDEKGDKMSKSLGNVIYADDAYKELGADILRLYYCCGNAPWETQKFNLKIAKELFSVMNVLWNIDMFIKTYVDKKTFSKKPDFKIFRTEDLWIISRINSLVDSVTECLEDFKFHQVGKSIVDFILNDFSRWYIKIIRDRTSPWYKGKDKRAAEYTILYVLEKLLRLMAPVTPFISEYLYQKNFNKQSVHLSPWPKSDITLSDKKLEKRMEIVKEIIEAMNSLRQERGIKLRWPVSELVIKPDDRDTDTAVKELEEVIKTMGNVKSVKIDVNLREGKKCDYGIISIGTVVKEDAIIREFIRNVQMLRKKNKLHVKERINIYVKTDEESKKILEKRKEEILYGCGGETLEFLLKSKKGEFEFEGKKFQIGFEK